MAVTPAANYSNSAYYKSSVLGKIFSKYRAIRKKLSFETYLGWQFRHIGHIRGDTSLAIIKVDSGLFKPVDFFFLIKVNQDTITCCFVDNQRKCSSLRIRGRYQQLVS